MKRITLSLLALSLLGAPSLTSCSKKDSPAEAVKPSSRISSVARTLSGAFHGEQMASSSIYTKPVIEVEDLVFTPYASTKKKYYTRWDEEFEAFGEVTSESYIKIDGVAQQSTKQNNLYSLRESGSEVYLTIYSLDGGLKDYVTGKKSRVITDVTADGFTLLRFWGATSLYDKMAFKRR